MEPPKLPPYIIVCADGTKRDTRRGKGARSLARQQANANGQSSSFPRELASLDDHDALYRQDAVYRAGVRKNLATGRHVDTTQGIPEHEAENLKAARATQRKERSEIRRLPKEP